MLDMNLNGDDSLKAADALAARAEECGRTRPERHIR
jgi:hypothetical protein